MDDPRLTEHVLQRRVASRRRLYPRFSPPQVAIVATALMLAMDLALAVVHPRSGWAWASDLIATCFWVATCLRVAVAARRDTDAR